MPNGLAMIKRSDPIGLIIGSVSYLLKIKEYESNNSRRKKL